ncbi:MAG TPA: hypothetical protein VE058_00345 [Steroidobacteraceae bacterium]|nr:hypothetical protein [Steroidobacteraceae bacterium]
MTPIKSAAVAASILALAACATPNTTLPPGFTGPSAKALNRQKPEEIPPPAQ